MRPRFRHCGGTRINGNRVEKQETLDKEERQGRWGGIPTKKSSRRKSAVAAARSLRKRSLSWESGYGTRFASLSYWTQFPSYPGRDGFARACPECPLLRPVPESRQIVQEEFPSPGPGCQHPLPGYPTRP